MEEASVYYCAKLDRILLGTGRKSLFRTGYWLFISEYGIATCYSDEVIEIGKL